LPRLDSKSRINHRCWGSGLPQWRSWPQECNEAVHFGDAGRHGDCLLHDRRKPRSSAHQFPGGTSPSRILDVPGQSVLERLFGSVGAQSLSELEPAAEVDAEHPEQRREFAGGVKGCATGRAAYDHEESCLGLCCVAVPVREFSGKGIAALSVLVPKQRDDSGTREVL
jgi:hypothetical protein